MVLTGRARVLTVLALFAVLYGVVGERWQVAVLGTTFLVWFGYEWFVFRYRIDVAIKNANVVRDISDRRSRATVLWKNQTYDVHTRISMPPGTGLTHVQCTDRKPETARLVFKEPTTVSALSDRREIEIRYQIVATHVGRIRFSGVHVQFNDLNGLFSADRFIHAQHELTVFPRIFKIGSLTLQKKRINQLPPPGVHRHVRAGVGSELLEIRDYIPGDPPRSIAWKLSAKRDTLLSKQYESEVPIRCNFMVDTSNGVRVGPPHDTTLQIFVDLAASVIETVTASRDPVGLTLFDTQGLSFVPPSANRKTVMRMVQQLAEACGKPVDYVQTPADPFIFAGIDLARELYPHLMQDLELTFGFRLFPLSPSKRRKRANRYQLASILAARYELGATGVGQLLDDDMLLSKFTQRFLAEFQKPYLGPIFNQRGESLFAEPKKIETLSRALLRRLGKGMDNELFIIMADFVNMTEYLEPLLRAIRCAKAKHHRVAVVCAWPNGYALPKQIELQYNSQTSSDLDIQAILKRNERQFHVRNYFDVRRQLSRLEVPLVCATDVTAPRLLMSQLDLVRAGRVA